MNDRLFDYEKKLGIYATKEDMSKTKNSTSRRFREIVELINNKDRTADEGMFTKKNLGPMACASCQKNLVNLEGMPVDYTVWKGMP